MSAPAGRSRLVGAAFLPRPIRLHGHMALPFRVPQASACSRGRFGGTGLEPTEGFPTCQPSPFSRAGTPVPAGRFGSTGFVWCRCFGSELVLSLGEGLPNPLLRPWERHSCRDPSASMGTWPCRSGYRRLQPAAVAVLVAQACPEPAEGSPTCVGGAAASYLSSRPKRRACPERSAHRARSRMGIHSEIRAFAQRRSSSCVGRVCAEGECPPPVASAERWAPSPHLCFIRQPYDQHLAHTRIS